MAKQMLVNLDLNKNELQNAVLQNQSADPTGAVSGQVFYDTDDNRIKMHDGTSFKKLITEDDAGSATMAGLTDTTIASTAAGNVLIYDGVDSWDNKAVSGDIAINLNGATTIQAGAVDFAMLNSSDVTSDLSISATSTQVASADAIKAYTDSAIATADAFTIQGGIDCSANPNYPAADAGDSYRVTVAGKIGGASGRTVEVGDLIICFTDSTASGTEATVGSEWIVEQNNIEAASETVAGYVELATVAEVVAGTDTTRAVTPASLKGSLDTNKYTKTFTTTIGDNSATSIAVTHNLGNQYVVAQAYIEASGALVECDITITNANTTTFGFGTAPANNSIRVDIVG